MSKKNEVIGFRDLTSLIIIIIGIKAIDVTPYSIFNEGMNATWMIPLIWLILLSFPLFFILKLLKNYKHKCIAEIIHTVTGKYVGFFLNFLFFLIFLFDTSANARAYIDVMNIMTFERTPLIVLLGSILLISGYIAYKGASTLTRTAFIIIPIFILGAILLNILILDDINFNFIYPLFGPGVKKISISSVSTFSYCIEYIYLGLLFKKVRDYKTYRNANIVGFVVALLYMSMMFLDYVLVFDYPGPNRMAHVFSQIVRMTRIGVFINNLEAIYFSLWVCAGIIRFAFYIYVTAILFGFTMKIEEKNHQFLILPITVFMLIIGLIPNNLVQTQVQFRDSFLAKGLWPLVLFLPFILWIVAKIRGQIKNETS